MGGVPDFNKIILPTSKGLPMDAIDKKILVALQEDASLSVAAIGQRVGLSSTPCWKRIQRLEAERYEIGLLTNPRWGPVDFLREVLYQLGVETTERSKPELLHQLHDLFFRNFRDGRDTVVIVDEAQLLEDASLFEELRLLMNFQTDDRFLVTILLIGSPELIPKVRRLKHLDQRITIRYHLNALDDTHTASYVAHRLKMAGRSEPIFTEAAIRLIFDFTRGTPREINNLCDVALLVGYTKRAPEIGDALVAEVIKDMVGVS